MALQTARQFRLASSTRRAGMHLLADAPVVLLGAKQAVHEDYGRLPRIATILGWLMQRRRETEVASILQARRQNRSSKPLPQCRSTVGQQRRHLHRGNLR